jgi:hypothetical protein
MAPLPRSGRRAPRLLAAAAAALFVCFLVAAPSPAAAQAFLQQELPLKPLVTTPSELLTDSSSAKVTLTGRQAITVSAAPITRG